MFNFECRRGMKFQSRHIHASGKWNACYLLKAIFLFLVFTSLAAQRKSAETPWDFHFSKLLNVGFLSFFSLTLLADFLFPFSYPTAFIPHAPSCGFSANFSIPFSPYPSPSTLAFLELGTVALIFSPITQFVSGKNLWLNFIHVHVRLL